ncbi:hypothetical protein SPRG_03229 [Saprolegnia parasitica CBS 223.65]|uniref:Uncharacterized protein n=1 Tax=Saprolegnia parasitica (strain CBS 223.65) TaxID=695850 RepID=A0A067CZQ3_SAPPC|nr:hypothetical protein SPRG_03229 [Saprolegnia parasitica CBS 223.65]KDO32011.1 hypothetical protein SPRG_03229 [Saprolegnia parasitica CBS 223.65]|eukprot:XP_012197204.1 hypothetical protein SPRG_03229 [Saprolegnia parasitica CBS 223.65]
MMDLFKSLLGFDDWTGKPHKFCSAHTVVVLGGLGVLILAEVTERFTFKLMLDRMESYRYFLMQMSTFLYIPPCSASSATRRRNRISLTKRSRSFQSPNFRHGHARPRPVDAALLTRRQNAGDAHCGLSASVGARDHALCPDLTQGRVRQESHSWRQHHDGWHPRRPSPRLFHGAQRRLRRARDGVEFAVLPLGSHSRRSLGALQGKALATQPMDVYYLNAWVAVYQFIGGLLLAPLAFDIPVLHLDQRISGLECLVNGVSEIRTDKCHLGLGLLLLFLVCKVVAFFGVGFVLQHTSVSVLYGGYTAAFPIAFALLGWYQSSGQADQDGALSSVWCDVFSCSVVLLGLILYRLSPEPGMEATTMSAAEKEAQSLLLDDASDHGLRYT